MNVALATIHHDPLGRMHSQIAEVLPTLKRTFASIAVYASAATAESTLDLLRQAGAAVGREAPRPPNQEVKIGKVRREAITLALRAGTPFLLYFDFDSLLHWAQHYPDELRATVALIPTHDLTLIGRTPRAMDTHPRNQMDTELLVNRVFRTVSGRDWDVMRAGRGLSRGVAELLLAECLEEGIRVDVVWPLFLLRRGGFTTNDIRVDGTEFETGDRYGPEIKAAGSYERWLAQLDADPRRWVHRLDLARLHVEALIPFGAADTRLEPHRIVR